MSVRGLVTVVIGVVAFVVIDSLSKMGALWRKLQMTTPLSQGSLNRDWHGNPELAEASCFGQVQRLYTGHPLRMKRKSIPMGNHRIDTSQILSPVRTREALSLAPLRGNSQVKTSLIRGTLNSSS